MSSRPWSPGARPCRTHLLWESPSGSANNLRDTPARRRDDGFEIEMLPRLRRNARRINEPVPADEDLVARSREIRQDVAALIVGDHYPGELRRQFRRFGDYPHAGLGAFRACDDATDV